MARLPIDQYTFPWGDAAPCPCGSAYKFVDCCKCDRQLPYVKIPGLLPPGPITDHQHPACYMSSTRNCSTGISREHYVSEAILQRFDGLKVAGMPWQKPGETQMLPSQALVANILCDRHNAALSPIDQLGLNAFDALIAAADYAVNQRHSGRAEHYLISGEGLELWMVKLMAGIHFGGIATSEKVPLRDNCEFPIGEAIEALTNGVVPANSGLFVTQNVGVVERDQIGVGPLIDVAKNLNIGVQVQFGALRFEWTIVPPPISALHKASLAGRRRPRVVDFVGPARDARVVFSWKGWANEVSRLGVEVCP